MTSLLLAMMLTALSPGHEVDPTEAVDSAFYLNDVVVTGTRTPKLLKDTPIQTRLITADDLRRSQASNVAEYLQQEVPGVEISLAMNQHNHLNFSGFGGQSILFLIDGERLAGETLDDVDFARLSLVEVERIEIIKGAASALYGSNATGGVVNIITKKASRQLAVSASVHATRRQFRPQVLVGTRSAKWQNTATLQATLNDHYRLHNGASPAARVVNEVYGDSCWSLSDRLSYQPDSTLTLSAQASYFQRQIVRAADAPDLYRDLSSGLTAFWSPSAADRLELSWHFDQYDKATRYRLADITTRQYSNVQHSLRAVYSRAVGTAGIVTLGADYLNDFLSNTKVKAVDHRQHSADAFAQYDWQPTDRVELVGALRYDYFSEGHLSRLTPKLSLRYTLDDHWTLRAAYGMGFRAPSLKERYYEFDMVGIWTVKGQPDLKAETSHNITFAADFTRGHYNVVVAAYYNNVGNRLTTGVPYYDAARQLTLDYINLDSYAVCGADVTLQAKWDCGLSARLAYAYTHEQLTYDKSGQTVANQYLPAREHALTARLDWEHRFTERYALQLSLNGRALSAVDSREYVDYYDVSRGTVATHYPAYTLWRLSTEQRFGQHVRLTVALDNLFNYQPRYYYFNSPLTEGATLMGTLAVDL